MKKKTCDMFLDIFEEVIKNRFIDFFSVEITNEKVKRSNGKFSHLDFTEICLPFTAKKTFESYLLDFFRAS